MRLALLTNNRFPPREGDRRGTCSRSARRLQASAATGHRAGARPGFARWAEIAASTGCRFATTRIYPLQPFHHALARTELAGWLASGADGAELLHVHLPLLPPLPARPAGWSPPSTARC